MLRSARHDRDADRFWRRLLLVALLGVAVRITYAVALRHQLGLGYDATWYRSVADELAHGRGYGNPFDPRHGATAYWPPGYPAFLSLAIRLRLRSVLSLRLVGCVGAGASIVGVGLLGRRVADERVALWAAGVVALSPLLIEMDASLMSESLAFPLVVAMFLMAYRAQDRPSLGRFVALGVVTGVTVYVRQEALLLFVLLAVVLVWRTQGRLAHRFLHAGAATLVVVAIMTPWCVRNTLLFHRTTLMSTELGITLAGANCARTYGGSEIGQWYYSCFRHDIPDERTADDVSRRQALRYARQHATHLPLVVPIRVLRTWGVFPFGAQLGAEAIEGRWRPWHIAAWLGYLAALPVACIGFVMLRRARADLTLLLTGVVATFVTSVVFYGRQRFRFDAEPLLALCTGAGIVGLLDRRWSRERRDRSGRPENAPGP